MKIRTKKCKQCKEPFVVNPIYPLQYICQPLCAIAYNKSLKSKNDAKEWKVKKAVMKINTHSKEHRKYLQDEINKLARLIDSNFGLKCIDCEKDYGKQIDGAHFHSRGANCSLRYNLHNIHSADSQCNCYSDTHKTGYMIGLINRYGIEYARMIESMPLQFKELKISNLEVYEKIKIVRGIIRNFKKYCFTNPHEAREILNEEIGIYKYLTQ